MLKQRRTYTWEKGKLIERLRKPKDFTFAEAETLLGLLTYRRSNMGKTSGSRVRLLVTTMLRFYYISLMGGKELLEYQVKQLLEILEQEDLL